MTTPLLGTCSIGLVVTQRNCKQPRCPSRKNVTENVVYLHHTVLLSCYKNEIIKFSSNWMGLKKILNEVTQFWEDKYGMYYV